MMFESLSKSSSCPWCFGGVCVVLAVVIGYVIHVFKRKGIRKACPPDTVLLHQFRRGDWAPNISPFPIKLETYLRMAKIPYKTDFKTPMSSKGKSPWITYNGVDVADSQLCIDFLNKELSVDLNELLSVKDRAVSLAFRKLIEEDLYWCGLLERWVYGDKNYVAKLVKLPYIVVMYISYKFIWMAWGQGMGRHSPKDVRSVGKTDLQAVSTFLGNNQFFMGDEPSEIDCALFGCLAQIKWNAAPSIYTTLLKDELVNLLEYCDRMKDRFWPDWDDCITHGGTRLPLK